MASHVTETSSTFIIHSSKSIICLAYQKWVWVEIDIELYLTEFRRSFHTLKVKAGSHVNIDRKKITNIYNITCILKWIPFLVGL